MSSSRRVGIAAALGGLAVTALTPLLVSSPAHANPGGTGLVISEVYGAGGNNGAVYNADFVELYNPTASALSLSGLAVHYRSASGGSGGSPFALSGSVPAHGHWLIQMSGAGSNGAALPTPDATAGFNMAAAGGQVALQQGTAVIATSGDVSTTTGLVDFVGATGASSFEKAATKSAATATQSLNRTAGGIDTNDNSADFALAAPTPTNSGTPGGGGDEPPPTAPIDATIAQIEGTTDTSPYAGAAGALGTQNLTTQGVVTATYTGSGSFNGFYLQTPGTPDTPGASDGIFVFGSQAAALVHRGDSVRITGRVQEFNGLTEFSVNTPVTDNLAVLPTSLGEVTPLAVSDWSALDTDAEKEAHESEVVDPTALKFTVSDNYDTNVSGTFGLAVGDHPLVTPTEVADAQDAAAIAAAKADNAARAIALDDGYSGDFFTNTTGKNTPMPWLTLDHSVRVGASATFHQPVILDFRKKETSGTVSGDPAQWTLEPLAQVTGTGDDVVSFSDTRADNLAPKQVGGDIRIATFNVLNYFPTTGDEFVNQLGGKCTFYTDRAGNNIATNQCGYASTGAGDGPRGAADAANLKRQQDKIVHAINTLGASIVSLEEIENSVKFGKDRDYALSTLVDALNAEAGSQVWAFAPSPAAADLPSLAEQDVIRTAFIYKPAAVTLVGASHVLVGSQPFASAREPLAQGFKRAGAPDSDAFAVIVNHFKSKGSGVDDGTGQGNSNPDRVDQANALVGFANGVAGDLHTDKVFLTGDFNAYSQEDPIQVLEGAGYTELNGAFNGGESTYSFDGMDGSLDHVFASPAAKAWVTGVDVWQINAQESVAYEYSRYNYNATLLYDDSPFRASDHDPEVIGVDLPEISYTPTVDAADTTVVFSKAAAEVAITVTADGVVPTGTVSVLDGDQVVGTGTLVDGRTVVTLAKKSYKRGTYTLTAAYSGGGRVLPGTDTFTLTVTNPAGQ
ncbi:ExeM/NucH family extracellular endonuclease [Nocardioides sp. CER19]|uniref:ExeM/NucH family extracellular endonuclease n=1 Tax=Nocardioides sp. CER19 TaxID=3038538 RepID=UPI00244C5D68|nr:ExeM/NucH family extracellular endonuclease [Nocardioides sp. CER19]MDH2415864.1 ExeM/NucH family extracellular endonuclease [Nocardioides sp. CER19]